MADAFVRVQCSLIEDQRLQWAVYCSLPLAPFPQSCPCPHRLRPWRSISCTIQLFVTVHPIILMDKRHMPRQCHIHIHIGNVQYQKHQIESTQQLVGHIDIL